MAVPLHALSLSTLCPGPSVRKGRLGSAPSCPLSLNAVPRPSRGERQAWQCPFMLSLSQRRAPALPWGKAGLAVPLHALSLSTPCPGPLPWGKAGLAVPLHALSHSPCPGTLPWGKAGLAVPLHALSLSMPCPGPPVRKGRYGSAPSCPLSLNAVPRPSPVGKGRFGSAPFFALSLSTPCPGPPMGKGRLGSAPSCPLSLNAVPRPSRDRILERNWEKIFLLAIHSHFY
jgi:hypothetical protein